MRTIKVKCWEEEMLERRKAEALKPSFIFNVFTALKCSKCNFSKLKCSYILKNPNKVICFFPQNIQLCYHPP